MANWCSNAIVFFTTDNDNSRLKELYEDLQYYQNYKDDTQNAAMGWVGCLLQKQGVDTKELSCRGFISDVELNEGNVRLSMDTAWGPLSEVYDIIAEKYGMNYVYIAEEPSMSVFINTDTEGIYFNDRYYLDFFEVEDLELDEGKLAEYGERLEEISGESLYFSSFDEVLEMFAAFDFGVTDIDGLNEKLEDFKLEVCKFDDMKGENE